jgi:hypothetical protein
MKDKTFLPGRKTWVTDPPERTSCSDEQASSYRVTFQYRVYGEPVGSERDYDKVHRGKNDLLAEAKAFNELNDAFLNGVKLIKGTAETRKVD